MSALALFPQVNNSLREVHFGHNLAHRSWAMQTLEVCQCLLILSVSTFFKSLISLGFFLKYQLETFVNFAFGYKLSVYCSLYLVTLKR